MARPGLMIRGQVVMCPSRCDGTHSYAEMVMVKKIAVRVNGLNQTHCVAYDQDKGEALILPRSISGQELPPQLLTGHIEVRSANYAA